MSKIDFKLLVESALLLENLESLFVPLNQNAVNIDQIEIFTNQLHATGSLRLNKDFLISNKSLWPYGDTLEYITTQFASVIPTLKSKQFSDQIKSVIDFIKSPQNVIDNFATNGLGFLNGTMAPELTNTLDSIDKKINYLNDNRLNYRNFSNTRLAQANNETSVLAAEPYLNKTPKDAVVAVLRDFGGYDQKVAEQVINYPAEPKYTQRAKNIDNMVMQNIIEISKLTLIFYREWIQDYANEVVDLLNFDREYQETVSRTFMVQQQQLIQALQQGAGTQDKKTFIENLLKGVSTFVGTERVPTDILQRLFYSDYLKFVEGKSSLVLRPESYSIDQSHDSLIKTIRDFNGQPGKGQNIYESYIHLFNNIKKGTLSSGPGIISRTAGALGALRTGMGPVG